MIYATDEIGSWKVENCPSFNELMVSWNGNRPQKGKFSIYVSVQAVDWSDWLLYSSWGAEGQESCQQQNAIAKVYQDAVEILGNQKGTGFQIRVEAEEGASLKDLRRIIVYTNGQTDKKEMGDYLNPVYLKVKGISQLQLNHERKRDLCSPTSTTAVVRYLTGKESIDPLAFAARARDLKFDIFGNWVLNVAEASHHLGPSWSCWVERLDSFTQIYDRLLKETPVIVSVRGPLKNSASPYAKGHLLAVIGWDPEKKEVICMDPAFEEDEKTHVRYALPDFLEAWERRGRIAYLFARQ